MLGPGRPVEQPLEGPENELHVDRLRTHPAAPHAAGQGRHQAYPQDQRDQRQGQQQVSVERKVKPKIVNSRWADPSSTAGLPWIFR